MVRVSGALFFAISLLRLAQSAAPRLSGTQILHIAELRSAPAPVSAVRCQTHAGWIEAGSKNVSVTYYCTILDDANFFINQAKGLPVVPSATPLRDRYIRMGVLCSWIALEEMLEFSIEEQGLSRAARRMPLRDRLDLALTALGREPVEGRAFMQARRVRNHLTHPHGNGQAASLEEAVSVFDFCFGAIRNLFRNEVAVRF